MSRRTRLSARLLLLATLVLPFVATAPAAANPDGPEIYWVDESADRVVQSVDPASLRDSGPPLSFRTGMAVDSTFRLSKDGSTALVGHYTVDGPDFLLDLRVIDVLSGVERSAFEIEGRESFVIDMSRDGGKVLVQSTDYDKLTRSYTTTFRIQSTADGSVLSEFALPHDEQTWFNAFSDDALAHMWLESSTIVNSQRYEGEIGALVLQHIDLESGREAGRLTLGSVEVGSIEQERVDDVPVFESVYPAIALSPDGRTLAVVEPATEQIVLVDGLTMSRIDTMTVREPGSIAGQFLRWTGLLPSTAEAKFQVGEWRSATFSADGASLYLTGGRGEIVGDTFEDYEAEWLGIRRVDLTTGEVEATELAGAQVDQIHPVASGEIYVLGLERPWTDLLTGDNPTILRRLDGATLSSEAERSLTTTTWQVIVTEPER